MGSALLNSIFSDYPKRLISRTNEVYVFFNKNIAMAIIIENKNNVNFIGGMVSVTSPSRFVTPASF